MSQPALDNQELADLIDVSLNADDDPYSLATAIIAKTLEIALDDRVNDRMGEKEFDLLAKVGMTLVDGDPNIRINPTEG